MSDNVLDFSGNKLGNLEIFPETYRCSHNVYDHFTRGFRSVLLIAQMQQGKTTTVLKIADFFINDCQNKGVSWEVIYLNNIADNVLKDQTTERVWLAGMSKKIKILHHADIRNGNLPVDLNVSRRLILVDECHLALEKDRPFDAFFKKIGIFYGKSPSVWVKNGTENYVLSFSATPFAHTIKGMLNSDSFATVVLPMSAEYYSFQHLLQDGRLRQSEQVVRKGDVTTFFKDRVEEFIFISQNRPGYLVVRAIGDAPDRLKGFIEKYYPNIDVCLFGSNEGNIEGLDRRLSLNPPNNSVVIIRGSLRAGKTLSSTRFIRMWLEPPTSNPDTMCQAIGRCLGYEMDEGRNRKFDDDFPIYCNMEEVDEAVKFFNGVGCEPTFPVPRSRYNKSSGHPHFEGKIEILGTTEEDVERWYLKWQKEQSEESKKFCNGYWIGRNSQDGYSIESVVMNKNAGTGRSIKERKIRVYHIDGPYLGHGTKKVTSDQRKLDWEELNKHHPEVIGKYVVILADGGKWVNPISYEDKINEICLLNEN